jgi:hypothetical protein
MAALQDISNHYAHGDLLGAIQRGLEALGRTTGTVTVDDLAPVDEFHIGGRQASQDFLSQFDLPQGMHILDVGCGLALQLQCAPEVSLARVGLMGPAP